MLEIVNEVRLTIRPDNDNPYLKGPFASNAREYTADTRSLKVIGVGGHQHDFLGRKIKNVGHSKISLWIRLVMTKHFCRENQIPRQARSFCHIG